MIEVECPTCDRKFAIDDSQLGTTVACPHCQQPVDMSGDLEDELATPTPVVHGPQKKKIIIQKSGGTFQAPSRVQAPPQQVTPGGHPSGVTRQPAPQPGASAGHPPQQRGPMRVVVSDIKMPLGSMVVFMLKLMVASIPVVIIVWIVGALLGLLFGGIIALFALGGG